MLQVKHKRCFTESLAVAALCPAGEGLPVLDAVLDVFWSYSHQRRRKAAGCGTRQTRRDGCRVQIKECCCMAQLQIVYLLRPGTQEQWRRLYQEIAESRREEFEASCRRMGITQVLVRLVQQ